MSGKYPVSWKAASEGLVSSRVASHIGINAVIALYIFPLWRKLRLRFLLIIGISALLGFISNSAQRVVEWMPGSQAASKVIWYASSTVALVDMVLYGIGIMGMMRYLRSRATHPATAAEA